MVANVDDLVIASEGPPLSKEELDELIVRAQQKVAEKYATLKCEGRESHWPTWSTAVNSAKRFLNALRLLVVLVSFHVMLAWVLCRYYSQYQRCAGDPAPFDSVMACFFFRLEAPKTTENPFLVHGDDFNLEPNSSGPLKGSPGNAGRGQAGGVSTLTLRTGLG